MSGNLYNMIVNSIARGQIKKATVEEDGTVTLKLDILAGENGEDVELFQQYGIASVPLEGAEWGGAFISGDRSNGIVFGVEDARYRLKGMKNGEVALYTDEGDVVHLKRGRTIEVTTLKLKVTAAQTVEFVTPLVKMSGNLNVTGTVNAATVAGGGVTSSGTMVAKGDLITSGSVTAAADVGDAAGTLAELREAYTPHVHAVTTAPGTTSGPVGPP